MIDFGNYRYIGNHNLGEDDSKYSFNDVYYQSLLRDNRYKDAADYLSKFEFLDSEEQTRHLNDIDELRRNGEIINAAYSKLDNAAERNAVEFADKVGTPGWYDALRHKKDANGNDIYATDAEFEKENPEAVSVTKSLTNIGSSPLHEATRLSVTFSPIKVGLFGWNWSKRNDTDDLDEFYNNGGFSQEQLEAAGVDIRKDDKTGETTISFDKTNAKALDILAALPKRLLSDNLVNIEGYYADGEGNYKKIDQVADFNKAQLDDEYPNPMSSGYNFDLKRYNFSYVDNIKGVLKGAKEKRDKIFEKRDLKEYEVSSTVFDLTTDRTDILNYMHEQGQLSDAEYNRRMKDAKDLVGWLRSQTYLTGVYSNINNEEFTDEHFESVGQEEWFKIKNALGEFEDKDVIIQGQTINGEIGLRVTLPQAQRKKRLASTEEGGFLHTDKRNVQFFIPASAIPGMLGRLQQQIDNRTDLQAVQDFNDMVGYGVKKSLYTGETIYVDDLGTIIREYNGEKVVDNRPNAKDKAINDLNQTRILEKGKYLKFQHMNNNGDIDYASYVNAAKKYAMMAGDDLVGVPLKDFEGNSLVSYNPDYSLNYGALFDPTLDLSNYQADVAREILKIREIYNELMNDIYNYNIIER